MHSSLGSFVFEQISSLSNLNEQILEGSISVNQISPQSTKSNNHFDKTLARLDIKSKD
jgi:hypothetical protein